MVKFSLLFLICSIFCQYTTQEKLHLQVYYEALCGGCQGFITNQLYPAYQKIGKNLLLDLVPYGNTERTKENGKWVFFCQHGPKECYGTKVQACVVYHNSDIETQLNFVNCVMASSDASSPINAEHCANQNNLIWQQIKECAEEPEGDEIFAHYGDLTDAVVPRSFAPYMLFNGFNNETVALDAFYHLLDTICPMFKVTPKGCLA